MQHFVLLQRIFCPIAVPLRFALMLSMLTSCSYSANAQDIADTRQAGGQQP